MKELLMKLADVLGISIGKVIETYPILRNQYVNSYLYASISNITICLVMFGVVIFMVIASITIVDRCVKGDINTNYLKFLIITLVVTVLLLILRVYLRYKVMQTAPDLMFIYRILQRGNLSE